MPWQRTSSRGRRFGFCVLGTSFRSYPRASQPGVDAQPHVWARSRHADADTTGRGPCRDGCPDLLFVRRCRLASVPARRLFDQLLMLLSDLCNAKNKTLPRHLAQHLATIGLTLRDDRFRSNVTVMSRPPSARFTGRDTFSPMYTNGRVLGRGRIIGFPRRLDIATSHLNLAAQD